MEQHKFYTGVGSRTTPPPILKIMKFAAATLAKQGYILRSGGADGADSAFERGAGRQKQIFYARHATPEAMAIAASLHPAWGRCGNWARQLHARNAFQVLGRDLKSPSAFVICFTPDGCVDHAARGRQTGGTGTAISIASEHKVPVFNLARRDHRDRILAFIEKQ